ncbi:hypothetical protein DFJ43DRAFT_1222500 [Lentinula guzmanii]|uniref:Uncharacterized protein n=1 Tax=Lentinula guzmanii TaxID=2804957 RepID=A0AA38JQX0_9AGAR|nr:hypothetical protein DFJ43DRAFT_1222500 [Lentinula guzmanii]
MSTPSSAAASKSRLMILLGILLCIVSTTAAPLGKISSADVVSTIGVSQYRPNESLVVHEELTVPKADYSAILIRDINNNALHPGFPSQNLVSRTSSPQAKVTFDETQSEQFPNLQDYQSFVQWNVEAMLNEALESLGSSEKVQVTSWGNVPASRPRSSFQISVSHWPTHKVLGKIISGQTLLKGELKVTEKDSKLEKAKVKGYLKNRQGDVQQYEYRPEPTKKNEGKNSGHDLYVISEEDPENDQ